MGDSAYRSFIERDQSHFLVALEQLFAWDVYSEAFIESYQGKGRRGRPPYDPMLIFKMLLISYLYDVPERDVERLVDEDLIAKWFVGLAMDASPPDHSRLSAFRRRLIRGHGWETLLSVFDDLLQQSQRHGLEMAVCRLWIACIHKTMSTMTRKSVGLMGAASLWIPIHAS